MQVHTAAGLDVEADEVDVRRAKLKPNGTPRSILGEQQLALWTGVRDWGQTHATHVRRRRAPRPRRLRSPTASIPTGLYRPNSVFVPTRRSFHRL